MNAMEKKKNEFDWYFLSIRVFVFTAIALILWLIFSLF